MADRLFAALDKLQNPVEIGAIDGLAKTHLAAFIGRQHGDTLVHNS